MLYHRYTDRLSHVFLNREKIYFGKASGKTTSVGSVPALYYLGSRLRSHVQRLFSGTTPLRKFVYISFMSF